MNAYALIVIALLLMPHSITALGSLDATPISDDGRVINEDMCVDMSNELTSAKTLRKMSTLRIGPEVCSEVVGNATLAPKLSFTPTKASFTFESTMNASMVK